MSKEIQRPLFNVIGLVGGSVDPKKHHFIPFLHGNESVWRTAFPIAKQTTFLNQFASIGGALLFQAFYSGDIGVCSLCHQTGDPSRFCSQAEVLYTLELGHPSGRCEWTMLQQPYWMFR